VFRKAIAKDPRERWQTAAELGAAIEDVYTETVGDAPPATSTSLPSSDSRARTASVPLAIGSGDHAGSDLRLRRSDLDAFERGIHRRRLFTISVALTLLVAGAGAAVWMATREPPPLTEEHEPNNDVTHANTIAANTEVTGYLGRRLSTDEGDRDVFVVPWAADSHHVVTIRVTGIPNIDLKLSVTDGDGTHGATDDDGGVGEGEVMHRRGIHGSLIVTVAQTVAKDQKLPVENISDPYTLTVTEEPAAGGEIEPNGTEADANPLAPSEELRGYLDARADVDLLRWTGGDGTFDVIVRADGLPLAWRTPDGKMRTPGAASVELHKGDIIRLERTDRTERGPLHGRDVMWSIVATPSR
jgi:hypothetical protein